jgi:hypothetical protein
VLNPNPPRMITVVIAAALILVGLSATVFPIDFVNAAVDAVMPMLQSGQFGVSISGFEITTEVGWLLLFAGDALLIAGSLLPGI